MSIFVFGSNLAGRHGAGAAQYAYYYRGAIYGKGWGRQGESYAIPTKDHKIQTLPLWVIKEHVDTFVQYAKDHPELEFQVTAIGCGLAGYHVDDIRPLFADAPTNCCMPPEFLTEEELGSMLQAYRAIMVLQTTCIGPIFDQNVNDAIRKMMKMGFFKIDKGFLFMTPTAVAAFTAFTKEY